GKTNMLQQLQRPDVATRYAADRGTPLVFCSLDANMLAERDGWGVFEGLSEALSAGLRAALPPDAHAEIAAAHAAILAAHGSYPIALRRYAAALDSALAHVRLVIIFDEFDALLPQTSDAVLRNLRGLRDRHKYRLMYLTLTRERLATLCSEACQEAVEPFLELFALCELGLHPLGDNDAIGEVERFAERHQQPLAPPLCKRIVSLSGGHPGMLRALTQIALTGVALDADPRALIAANPSLRDECLKLWNDLSGDEREAIWQAHGGGSLDRRHGEDLLLKGLLRQGDHGRMTIFSPLLAAVVAVEVARTTTAHPDDSRPAPIIIDHVSQQVYYYGHQIGDRLSPLNFRLLAYLFDHYGAICSEANVAGAVYPGELPDGDSERVSILVRRMVSRLKEIAPDEPVLLQTIRGRGYRLGLPPN
ncbi:winged helix-turn-helix transcriptional regulator, partial [Chloroflexales bacterium ZM16-3]|nr:winged helix-turn-helix transcriptional regulator [Chloroflexales bacterium ZM16-3]